MDERVEAALKDARNRLRGAGMLGSDEGSTCWTP